MDIRRAGVEDVELLVPLFDDYRRFYRMPSDPEGARKFLHARLSAGESVVFLLFEEGRAVGFTQLYPSFSSCAMKPIFVLNDLFVAPSSRGGGAGTALLKAAEAFARTAGAARLSLTTELTNETAQRVYEKAGWRRDAVFCTYELPLH